MTEFFQDLQSYAFLQYAVLAGLLASIACGMVGSYVAVRRITYIAGAIAHCTLGGLGAARYLEREHGWAWLTPLHGAVVAALIAAVVIWLVTVYGRQREDTVLGAVWAVGMALGLVFISRTGGYSEDLMSYLFGNILLVTARDLWLIGLLDAVIVVVVLVGYNRFLAICFDEDFARLRGVPVSWFYLLLLCLTALTVVVLVQVVGIVLVIALLTLPAAAAAHFTRRLWQTMLWAVLLSGCCTVQGLALSYRPDLPAGPTIILLAAAVYVTVLVARAGWKAVKVRQATNP